MGKTLQPDQATASGARNSLKLPDLSSWDDYVPGEIETGDTIGKVVGIDQEEWAVALVDLTAKADRIDAERARMYERGYRKVEGEVSVIGWRKPEVWVKPREIYDAARAAKRARLRKDVRDGRLPDTALMRPVVKFSDGRGNEITVE